MTRVHQNIMQQAIAAEFMREEVMAKIAARFPDAMVVHDEVIIPNATAQDVQDLRDILKEVFK